jgi:hypothetical protein
VRITRSHDTLTGANRSIGFFGAAALGLGLLAQALRPKPSAAIPLDVTNARLFTRRL